MQEILLLLALAFHRWLCFRRTLPYNDLTRIAEEEQGIIPRVITGMYDLLREALEERPNVSYSVRCQFLEIYGEEIHDLLEPAGSTVTIREGQNGEVNVHGAKEMLVNGAEVWGIQYTVPPPRFCRVEGVLAYASGAVWFWCSRQQIVIA